MKDSLKEQTVSTNMSLNSLDAKTINMTEVQIERRHSPTNETALEVEQCVDEVKQIQAVMEKIRN
jgi:hypothetical protein